MIPFVSSESTTRSGFFAAIASALGWKPDRSVFGASAGIVGLVVDRDDLRAGADREEHLGRGRRQRHDLLGDWVFGASAEGVLLLHPDASNTMARVASRRLLISVLLRPFREGA